MSVEGWWRVRYYQLGLASQWETAYFSTEQDARQFCQYRRAAWMNQELMVKDPEFITVFELIQQGTTEIDQ